MNMAAKACIKRDEFDKGMRDTAALIREGMIDPEDAGLLIEDLAWDWIADEAEWFVRRLVDGEEVERMPAKSSYLALVERNKLRRSSAENEWYEIGYDRKDN